MSTSRALSGEARCRHAVVERRIHQPTSRCRRQAVSDKGFGRRGHIERDNPGWYRVATAVVARERCELRVDLDQLRSMAGRAEPALTPPADAAPNSPPITGRAEVAAASKIASWPHGALILADAGAIAAENASSVVRLRDTHPAAFMRQAGIGQNLTRRAVILLMDENPPRQDAKRPSMMLMFWSSTR